MDRFSFQIAPEIQEMGIRVVGIFIDGVDNRIEREADFFAYRESVLREVRETFREKEYKQDQVLGGFRELHTLIGRSNRDYVASPEVFLGLWLEKERFPRINPVVDIYNLLSLQTRLALGAHDREKLSGSVILGKTNGTESFIPLAKNTTTPIFPNEYAYLDQERKRVICRLEVLQCEETKVTAETRNIFLIVQGNAHTSDEYVRETAQEAGRQIKRFCGGSFTVIDPLVTSQET